MSVVPIFDSPDHAWGYHFLAGIVQPGQDRKLAAALLVLAKLPKLREMRSLFSPGRIGFDGVAARVKDRDVAFFARDIAGLPADPDIRVNRLKEKYRVAARNAVLFYRGEIPWDHVATDLVGEEDDEMLEKLIEVANRDFDGHFTLMKFSTNWRCCFGTVSDYEEVSKMASGKTMNEAIERCIEGNVNIFDF